MAKKSCRIDGSVCKPGRCIECIKFESYQEWVEQTGQYQILVLGRNMTVIPTNLANENG